MPHPNPTHEPGACPDRETLVAFHTGRLSEPESERLAEHLGRCGTCLSSLRDLSGDTGGDSFQEKLLRHCGDRGAFASTADPGFRAFEVAAFRAYDSRTWPGGAAARAGTAVHEDAEFDTSERYGPYAVRGIIAKGGMGVVFRADHLWLKRTVALKTLHVGPGTRPDVLARFRREGAAIARLDHPNVVRVYDSGEDGGRPYLAMELVEGETLEAKLRRGPLGATEAAELVRTLAVAVAYTHDNKILHRDLKPSNVLVTRDDTPKLADFGLAHIIGDPAQLTVSDAVMGTPAYMAPEQAAGRAKDVTVRTDVYALGVILYQALTGTPPFIAEDKFSLLRLVRQGGITPPSQCRSDVPADLETICLKCLEHSQKDRYPSATSLRQDLDRWLDGQEPVGKLPGRTKRAWRLVQHHAVTLTCVLAACVVFSAGVAGLAQRGPETAPPNGESQEVLRGLERDLDAGSPVTLVGEAGYPKWFKWRVGGDVQRTHIQADGMFSAENIDRDRLCVLELLPDSRSDRYTLAAELRHDAGSFGGFIGLYVGHQVYARQTNDAHFLCHTRFYSVAPGPVVIQPNGKPGGAPQNQTHPIAVVARTFADTGSALEFDRELLARTGGSMPALLPRNTAWHPMEVAVGPNEVVVRVAGRVMRLAPPEFTEDALFASGEKLRKRFPNDAVIQNMRPVFSPRGGLGLILAPSAECSIRRVVVTPQPVTP